MSGTSGPYSHLLANPPERIISGKIVFRLNNKKTCYYRCTRCKNSVSATLTGNGLKYCKENKVHPAHPKHEKDDPSKFLFKLDLDGKIKKVMIFDKKRHVVDQNGFLLIWEYGRLSCCITNCSATIDQNPEGEFISKSHSNHLKCPVWTLDATRALGGFFEHLQGPDQYRESALNDKIWVVPEVSQPVEVTKQEMDQRRLRDEANGAGPSRERPAKTHTADDDGGVPQQKKQQPPGLYGRGNSKQQKFHGHAGGCHSSEPRPKPARLPAPNPGRPKAPPAGGQVGHRADRETPGPGPGPEEVNIEEKLAPNLTPPNIVLDEGTPPHIEDSSDSSEENYRNDDKSPGRQFELDPSTNLFFHVGKRMQFILFMVWNLLDCDLKQFLTLNNEPYPVNACRFQLLAIVYDVLSRSLHQPIKLPVICQRCHKNKAIMNCAKHQVMCLDCAGAQNGMIGQPPPCPACARIIRTEKGKSIVEAWKNGVTRISWKVQNPNGELVKLYLLPDLWLLMRGKNQEAIIRRNALAAFNKETLFDLMSTLNGIHYHDLADSSHKMLQIEFQLDLALRKPVPCFKCGRGRRVVTKLCGHSEYCGQCITDNKNICLECSKSNVEEGYEMIEHVIV